MIRNKLTSFLTLFLVICQVSILFGQTKFEIKKEIFAEFRTINRVFSDSLSQYDYNKDKEMYMEKYGVFYQSKIENLSKLYQNLYNDDLESTESTENPKTLENTASSLLMGVEGIENGEQLKDLGTYLATNFPTDLIVDDSSGTYKCQLTFLIDTEGKFKKIKYFGSDRQFNLISALFLYSIGNLEKPLLSNGKPVERYFTQPIKLIFE